MKIKFIYNTVSPRFECERKDGSVLIMDYNLPLPADVNQMSIEQYSSGFAVELLINPMLSKGADMYPLVRKGNNRTIGMVFPISDLDSDPGIADERQYGYFIVAFYELLKRLDDEAKDGDISCNFEKNVFVCVFNKRQAENENPLHLCIHSLRKYGYVYFEENNLIEKPNGYDETIYKPQNNKIKVEMIEPPLYVNEMVNTLLRELPRTSNITHRFVLLYQIIELLMDLTTSRCIDDLYRKFRENTISNTDFVHDVGEISKEKFRINEIFEKCKIISSDESKDFSTDCKTLFRHIHYSVKENIGIAELYYKFRNQMTHQYRYLLKYKGELALTIQAFERLTMLVIEKYPYANE